MTRRDRGSHVSGTDSPPTHLEASLRTPQRAGFTLIELLLVTVILGLLASLVAPSFNRAREKAWSESVTSDVRAAITVVERMVANGQPWPSSIEEVEAAGWVPSEDTAVCLFIGLPASRFRGEYFIMVAANPGAETVVWTAYPILDGRVSSFTRRGQRGCEGFAPRS